ncbi:hypothetical protein FSP39_014796 [Pinctada imbricata]|uniref:Uncharacterized protein n=1 Tax=Pinctada imbricata TaxID=66713 RepID=A0AA88YNR6_PINIB|nr:hypothetical protein FSP39_014796 [Pinctada imbricata]
MNYIEIGLPHSEFVPTRKEFTPRRLVPLSGLGKKYLGLEALSKTEIDSLVNRLSQPKPNNRETSHVKGSAHKENKTKRFTGRKRMSSDDMKSMIDRLTKSKNVPEPNRVQAKDEENTRGETRSCLQSKFDFRHALPIFRGVMPLDDLENSVLVSVPDFFSAADGDIQMKFDTQRGLG